MPITPRKRPKITQGFTEKIKTGCGNLYVTVNYDEEGICETFATLGKTGGCASAQIEGIGRLISQCLRSGMSVQVIVDELKGIRCPSSMMDGEVQVLSCADAISKVLAKEVKE